MCVYIYIFVYINYVYYMWSIADNMHLPLFTDVIVITFHENKLQQICKKLMQLQNPVVILSVVVKVLINFTLQFKT